MRPCRRRDPRRDLIEHGTQASDVDVQLYGSFVTFSDPDGNTWALQQLLLDRRTFRQPTHGPASTAGQHAATAGTSKPEGTTRGRSEHLREGPRWINIQTGRSHVEPVADLPGCRNREGPLDNRGPPASIGCQLIRGRRGTGGLEGLVICCRVTAVSGGPSIANTGARPPVAVKVADPPTVPAADAVKLTG